ncbi:LacI family DNA-binding transcriptional regulator [Micromonospora sp. NPDC047793]|uniref:LacI family DNA-binding transcriptional regulator n=1 Tax=Micromonospora sp. NPDC047793 TaxID=3154342 RepID=UPI0033E63649
MTGTHGTQPTLRDVARVAGVHLATASRALSGSKSRPVNSRTEALVRQAAAELGYVPDQMARSLRTHRSAAIGVLIPDMSNPVMPPLVRGAEQVLARHGYTTLFADTDNDPVAEAKRLGMLLSWRVAGIILATARRDQPLPVELTASGVPVVMMSRKVDATTVPSATVDESVGVAQALDHLIGLGHRRIAYLGVPLWTSAGHERYVAFQHIMRDRGLPVPEGYVVAREGYSERDGESALAALLADDEPPTAVLAGNDMMALGCYAAIRAAGLSCPGDISVVGYNDMPLTDRVDPALTTVRVPYFDVGRRAATLLVEALTDGDALDHSVRLTPRLVVRASTAPVRPCPSQDTGRGQSG